MKRIRAATAGKSLTLMLKADAYNHGATAVAKVCASEAERFGVATPKEGMALREAGIKLPIDVFSSAPRDMANIVSAGLTPVVHSFETAAEMRSCRGAEAEVKLDTGMHRTGFRTPSEAEMAGRMLSDYGVKVRALVTHFASKETAAGQLARFRFLKEVFEHAYGAECSCEAAASDGLEQGYVLDGVRIGRSLYAGAMRVISEVASVNRLRQGETAGYNGIYVAKRDTATAVIEGGYADGIRRDYRGAEVVAAGGERMEIAAVCMDVFIAANAPASLRAGDKVEVFGEDTLDSFLGVSDANIYEIYTSFKGRTERKYITDGKTRDTESDTFPPRKTF